MSEEQMDDKKTQDGPPFQKTEAFLMLGASTFALGFPVPPTITKNIMSSVSALVTAAVAVPTAYLEAWAQGIRAEGSAKEAVNKGTVQFALSTISGDKELAQRATMFLGGRMLREQKARENITGGMLNQLHADPPREDAKCEIDDDWLDMFTRIAETKSNAEMQAYFAKLLVGEIKKPGSFSPATVDVLARITPNLANRFQAFCNISAKIGENALVIAEPFGVPGNNALAEVGFNYHEICELQAAGLVHSDLTAWNKLTGEALAKKMLPIAGKTYFFNGDPKKPKHVHQIKVINFTSAGRELRGIVQMEPNPVYIERLRKWVQVTFGLELLEVLKVLEGGVECVGL